MNALSQQLYSQEIQTAGKHIREFTCLAFSTDLETLFAGTTSGDVAVILTKTRIVQTFIQVCSAGVFTVACVPTGGEGYLRLVAGGGDGTVTALSGPNAADLKQD